ncbi:MFS transporter [Nitrosovibrio sp. Nv17]|uniref:MFS transporter n=1 Tax=Nitrosovibrio sp. Nv17 TaxID=1855339 RepID=UPI00090911DD|nr:MFS transporter [Nitrosovibrio sp. Nv17]SFW36672.1 Predicted arabinose efflux permease, MFS family [Nitrosovibrio sp. Nv17]
MEKSPATLHGAQRDTSPWAPLAQPLFRTIWIATLVSNIGTWMHDVGAAWLMTTLAPTPIMVSLVQAATTLPMFLFALPAGALADIVDRRRLLILAQCLMLIAATTLGLLQFLGLVTPAVLLLATFVLGLGAALNAPPFQAIVPELVSREDLSPAVALNSLGVNIARAIGPALGGAIVAVAGPGAVFVLNGLSVLGVLVVLARWRRGPRSGALPPERFIGALQAGFRYARRSPDLHTVLLRAGAVFVFASATWALLPLIARQELGLGAGGYGILLGCVGSGAVFGALVLPRFRRRASADAVIAAATSLLALAAIGFACLHSFPAACGTAFLAGAGWIAALSTLNIAAQMALPNWVKARTLAVYLVVFNGSMAGGSALWGAVATRWDIPAALTLAAGGQLLALLLVRRRRLPTQLPNLEPSLHWPVPATASDPELERGPVLVTVEYLVPAEHATAFIAAMDEMRRIRHRDGATLWRLFEDTARPGRWIEFFELDTWVEHLRQHERVTEADRATQERIRNFHAGSAPPAVSHLVAPPRK